MAGELVQRLEGYFGVFIVKFMGDGRIVVVEMSVAFSVGISLIPKGVLYLWLR